MLRLKLFALALAGASALWVPVNGATKVGDCVGGNFSATDWTKKCKDKSYCVDAVNTCRPTGQPVSIPNNGNTFHGYKASARKQTGTCQQVDYGIWGCRTCSGTVVCAKVTYYSVIIQQPDGTYTCTGAFTTHDKTSGNCV